MLQINTNRQQYCQIYQTPNAVIRFIWIAAFGVSTKFAYLRLILPGDFSYCYFNASVAVWARFFAPTRRTTRCGRLYRCRSPPLISILPDNSEIEIGGITHERNQFAGLLPVLYTGCDC